ncbi:MAG: MFS transporter [Pseudomonadales bacterium]|nr:MFS transporter [Pseudomonadales bacterium]NRA17530.1 MFS transporter [Oceanospirillaceae bacterium]
MQQHNLRFLYFMECFAGLARGSYLVCIGWTTLIVSDDIAAVGQVFITAMLTSILAGPIIGIIVDRYNRKYLTIITHFALAMTLLVLGLALSENHQLPVFWFFIAVIIVTFFRLIYQGSHDGLIHANVNKDKLASAVARFRGLHLLATAAGTLLTGFIIDQQSPAAGFYFAAGSSVVLIFTVISIKYVSVNNTVVGANSFFTDFSSGLAFFRNSPQLLILALIAAIALPIGQLSNAILSSFIRDDLALGSDAFGFVDAAWPVGGMLAAMLLSLGLKKLAAANMVYILAVLIGLITVIFSAMSSIIPLAILHAALGFCVWMCRITIDSRVLQICTEQTIGRTKAYLEMAFSVGALLMCLSPTFVKLSSSSDYFYYWGLVIIFFSSILAWDQRRKFKQEIESAPAKRAV